MKSFSATLLLFFFCTAHMAQAGAWLREKGDGFVSLSFGATQFSETTNAFYFEYGLSDTTTIGLDVSAFTNSQNVRNGFGNLFMRRNLGRTDGDSRWAYEIGFGGIWGNEMQRPTLKTALSWGGAFEIDDRSGWVNIDGAFIYEPRLGENIIKLDGTFGLDFSKVATALFEVTMSHQNNDVYGAVEPSLLIRPKGGRFNVKLGAQIPFDGQEKTALKLGLWHNF